MYASKISDFLLKFGIDLRKKLFKDVLAAWAGGGDIIAYILTGLVLMNFVPELIINVVFGTVGHTIIHVVKKS